MRPTIPTAMVMVGGRIRMSVRMCGLGYSLLGVMICNRT